MSTCPTNKPRRLLLLAALVASLAAPAQSADRPTAPVGATTPLAMSDGRTWDADDRCSAIVEAAQLDDIDPDDLNYLRDHCG